MSCGALFVLLLIAGAIAGAGSDEDDAVEVGSEATTTRLAEADSTEPDVVDDEPPATDPPPTEPPATEPPTTEGPAETVSQENAREQAESYLDYTAFSRTGLIDQLMFEGFSEADSIYGVDALNVDWNQQAALKAASYLEYSSFSRSGLIDQLLYEGFTQAEAEYGVSTTGL